MTLIELQQRMSSAVMRPLGPSGDTLATDAAYIKPRLTSLERLEIYNRQYWYRLVDSFAEDFPGPQSILGKRSFARLAHAYLSDCPSESFTLRDLGSRLETWLQNRPNFAGPTPDIALDMVRLEWARIEAFDGARGATLQPEDLAQPDPDLKLALQPYIRLLRSSYAVDALRVRAERRRMRITPEAIHIAVYGVDNVVCCRRLNRREYDLLAALSEGRPIARAIDCAFEGSALAVEEIGGLLRQWFAAWAELRWLCRA